MFNQKVNHFTSENPDYLNYSLGSPYIRPVDIHNCGTTIERYRKAEPCGALPLQSWCSPNVEVESFGMRPIVNSKEYFENIKKYLASIIYTDSIPLKQSGLANETYTIANDYSREPDNSLLQTVNTEAVNTLQYLMSESSNQIDMFKNYNPLCEGFVIIDIDVDTYRSTVNKNHFYHKVIFSAVNTTRYNSVSFKAELYQDATPISQQFTNAINDIQNSRNVPQQTNTNSLVYVSYIDFVNNTSCVVGQESECEFKGYNLNKSMFSQQLNDNLLSKVQENNWTQYPSLSNDTFNNVGNYDADGQIKIVDTGPSNILSLIQSFLK